MVDFRKSKWTNFAQALGKSDPNLQYAKGGGLANALMSGLGAYGTVRGGREDEASKQSVMDALKVKEAEQQAYERGQDQFTNQLSTDKFGLQQNQFSYGQDQDAIKNQLAQDQFGYGKEKDIRDFGLSTDKFAHTQESDILDRAMKEKVAGITAAGTAATGQGLAGLPSELGYSQKKMNEATGTQLGKDTAAAIETAKETESSMPNLLQTIDGLKETAGGATFSGVGRAKDFLAREIAGEATPGAVARTKFEADISNIALPLLKQTFGAAFTVEEGKELKTTFGDPNKTPEEKLAALDSKVESQIRIANADAAKAGFAPIDYRDPNVKQAIYAGYTVQEIRDFYGE